MLKALLKDSAVYAVANAVQKLSLVVIIPIITAYLPPQAFAVYDVSFVSAFAVSWLLILGQDSAASLLYFDRTKTSFDKRQVLAFSLWLQLAWLFLLGVLSFPFIHGLSRALFTNNAALAQWWPVALLVLPGHLLYYHALNVLLWQKRKRAYLFLCFAQTAFLISSVCISIITFGGGIASLFYSLMGSVTAAGLMGLWLMRKAVFISFVAVPKPLIGKLLLLGIPFALTAFFQQLLPAVDRYFLLHFHYEGELAPYVLAAKIGTLVNFGGSAFVLAFTPYSLDRLNEEGAEAEISGLFRTLSVAAFLSVPALLLFRDVLVGLFANASYAATAKLLPFFFFGWVFDLFIPFALLGLYRSHKTHLSLLLFAAGIALVSALNLLLVPVMGTYGAAVSFCVGKAGLFATAWLLLRRHFHLRIHVWDFSASLLLAAGASYAVYVLPFWASVLLVAGLLAGGAFFLLSKNGFRRRAAIGKE